MNLLRTDGSAVYIAPLGRTGTLKKTIELRPAALQVSPVGRGNLTLGGRNLTPSSAGTPVKYADVRRLSGRA